MTRAGIVLLLSGFPRRSETFALNEALALDERDDLAAIFATKPGDGLPTQPSSDSLLARVQYLPAGDAEQQARALVERLSGQKVAGLHAYFAHTPAAVAELAARTMNVPFSFSVHARDARKVAAEELARRACAAACVIACNSSIAASFDASRVALHILPHGVDTKRFTPQPLPPKDPLRLLAVGRLVEKKGFDYLIQAVQKLSFPFHLRIVGDGPQRETLAAALADPALSGQVELCSSVTHDELPALYAAAHVVIVPSIVDRSGDRDGLPNVLLEAMASGRTVVGSDVGAIGSALIMERTGLLVPPENSALLAQAIRRLAHDPTLSTTLAANARNYVVEHFDLRSCTNRFCRLLESTYALQEVAV